MVTGFRHYAFTRLNQPLAEKIAAVLLVAGFAIIGSLLIVNTKATTPTASKEAESGTITAPATLVNDTSASGSKAVRFNPASTGGGGGTGVSSTTPCNHSPAPAQWKHVVVLIFENKTYSNVIGNVSAPWISQLATKCGTYANWYDANFKVTGASDGSYASKPNYATMTSGVPPTVHGLTNDTYTATSGVDNIFNRLRLAGISTKSYESGTGGSCAVGNFSGSYHDPMRYYTNLGGQSSSPTTFCNTHDVPIANFMTDVNSGNLPAYSFILPTNDQNMHNNSVSSGDAWAQSFLKPF
jgi:phospholipase C